MNPLKPGWGVLAIVTFTLCAFVPQVALAQSDAEKKAKAKEHYEIGTRFYDVGKYGEAVKEYEESYLLTGDPKLLYNIGQAYRLWDHSEEALRVYKNYLRQRPDAENRADVEKKIADLEKVVEDRRRGAGPQPAEVVSPPPVGQPLPPVAPPPVTSPETTPPQPPAGGVVAGPPLPAAPTTRRAWLTYSLLGVGGAGLITAMIAAAVGANKAKKLQDASQNHQPFDPAVEQNGKTANAVAVTAGVVGLAAGAVGGYFLWRDHKIAHATVSLAPAISPTFAGGSAALTF